MPTRTGSPAKHAQRPLRQTARHAVGAVGIAVGIAVGVTACAVENGASRPVEEPAATTTLAPLRDVSVLGAFTHRELKESSSAVPSRRTPGVFWTHNDAGDEARIFAFDSTGRDLGTVRVRGSRNRDWEAMAMGPCDKGACLYIGDVGDNVGEQKFVSIFRIEEPLAPGRGLAASTTLDATLRFRYPDGAHDVEAMWVDADTSLWLATKRRLRDPNGRNRPSLVFRVPASAWRDQSNPIANARESAIAIAELIDSLPIVPTNNPGTMVSDAAYSAPFADGRQQPRLAVRTYDRLLVFSTMRAGRPGTLLGECSLRPLNESQGEGIAWLPDGRVLLSSESRGAPLYAARCP